MKPDLSNQSLHGIFGPNKLGKLLINLHTQLIQENKVAGYFEDYTIPTRFTHVEYYPKKRLDILGRFCVGFKVVYDDRPEDNPDNKKPDTNPKPGLPNDWEQYTFNDIEVGYNGDGDNTRIEIGTNIYFKAGEDWANKEHGITDLKNWFEFQAEFNNRKGKKIHIKELIIWKTSAILFPPWIL